MILLGVELGGSRGPSDPPFYPKYVHFSHFRSKSGIFEPPMVHIWTLGGLEMVHFFQIISPY